MADLSLKHVYKVYSDGTIAVSNFHLDIEDGEFVILVGPSGCGKSTTLRMIAGLEDITAGDLFVAGQRANMMEPKERNMAMVFQNYALYPHMNVYENMAFGLRIQHVDKNEIDNRVKKAAEILGLTSQLKKKPKDMSGGQRQRVALGRAIVRNPSVFLLDEPLSNLDAKLRASMRSEIRRLHNRLKTTFIYVTHDQVEAMTMGTKIVVMNKGFVQQVDAPMNLYDYPENLFVAGFIGTPQMNFYNATAFLSEDKVSFELAGYKLETSLETYPKLDKLTLLKNNQVKLGIRPEHMSIITKPSKGDVYLEAEINLVEVLGNETVCQGNIKGTDLPISIKINRDDSIREGETYFVKIDMSKVHIFSSETTNTLCPRIPSYNYVSYSKKGIVGLEIPESYQEILKGIKNPSVKIPLSAICEGTTYKAKIVNKEQIKNKYLLTLELRNGARLFKDVDYLIEGDTYTFDIKPEMISFFEDGEEIISSIPENNLLKGVLIPSKRPVTINGKVKKMKVFDYQIQDLVIRPNDDRVNKIYALLGKKFHLHTIEFSFAPSNVALSNEGLKGKVEEILNYGENATFAKILVGDVHIFAKINSNETKVEEEVFVSLNADELGVRDVNFNVIIF